MNAPAKHASAQTRPPAAADGPQATQTQGGSDWSVLRTLFPYLWQYKWRVFIALSCLLLAKFANVAVPLSLKQIVDALTPSATQTQLLMMVPIGAVLAYGALRLSTSLFTELRELVFARVTQSAVRTVALQVFEHMHALSLRFHLERQTGGLTRDIERGTRGISSLVSYTLYSILPTLVEVGLVIGILAYKYDIWFTVITVCALTIYITYTVAITEWRTRFRRQMNELDSRSNQRAIDSLLNFETVKYFGNEKFEAKRYHDALRAWEDAALKSQSTLSLLNVGQQLIIAIAVTLMVWHAASNVAAGKMTLGDLVLINAFIIQLYIPLNFLGVIYREIKQSLTDMEKMFNLLHVNREVADQPNASALNITQGTVRFENVQFGYDERRTILQGVSFEIAPGTTTAVVGSSGAGKSTLSRLLFRFYDVNAGRVLIDGQDIRNVTQQSLRQSIGIVPQDTVLFNDTLAYNIRYGRPQATDQEVEQAAAAAQLDDFIRKLPDGYQTTVGERGLKLSGGEKQRVAIARMLLKQPAILVFDEATSALDSRTEQAIQSQMHAAAQGRTALVIAHRLSTIVDADQIIVLENGKVAEQGTHIELLERQGAYARMWALQQRAQESDDEESGEFD